MGIGWQKISTYLVYQMKIVPYHCRHKKISYFDTTNNYLVKT